MYANVRAFCAAQKFSYTYVRTVYQDFMLNDPFMQTSDLVHGFRTDSTFDTLGGGDLETLVELL